MGKLAFSRCFQCIDCVIALTVECVIFGKIETPPLLHCSLHVYCQNLLALNCMTRPEVDGLVGIDPGARSHNGIAAIVKRSDGSIKIVHLSVTDDLGDDPKTVIEKQLRQAFVDLRAHGCDHILVMIEDQATYNSQRQALFVERHLHEVCEDAKVLHLTVATTQKDRAVESIHMQPIPPKQRKSVTRNTMQSFLNTYKETYGAINGWTDATARKGQRDMADALAIVLADNDVISTSCSSSPHLRVDFEAVDPVGTRAVPELLLETHAGLNDGPAPVFGVTPNPVWMEARQRFGRGGAPMGRGWGRGSPKAYWMGPDDESRPRRIQKRKPVRKPVADTPAHPPVNVPEQGSPGLNAHKAAMARAVGTSSNRIDLTHC